MEEKNLKEYIDILYKNQNSYAAKEQCGLYTKKAYYNLLKPVKELIKNNKGCSIDSLRDKLFITSRLESKIKSFIKDKDMAPGIVLSYGTKYYQETIVFGNKSEVTKDKTYIQKMTEDTIFDLASITKLFTSLSILILVEKGLVNLNDEIIRYEPRFKKLKGVSIFDLLSFKVSVITKKRIDSASSLEEAESIVYSMEINNNTFNNPYTDMGAIVLKYVIERASNQDFYHFIKENILKKAHMTDTYSLVPKTKLKKLASTNLGFRIMDNNKIEYMYVDEGLVHDPKARILGQKEVFLSGHAGLFSSAKDMTNLCKSLIDGKIISKKNLYLLAKNKTGKISPKGKYIPYYGLLCYIKNPILKDSNVFYALSGVSFSSSGYTGGKLTIDPINELYLFLGANRTHNRVFFISQKEEEKTSYDHLGRKIFKFADGNIKTVTNRFAWERDDAFFNSAIELLIQYKFLEDYYQAINKKITPKKRLRKI